MHTPQYRSFTHDRAQLYSGFAALALLYRAATILETFSLIAVIAQCTIFGVRIFWKYARRLRGRQSIVEVGRGLDRKKILTPSLPHLEN